MDLNYIYRDGNIWGILVQIFNDLENINMILTVANENKIVGIKIINTKTDEALLSIVTPLQLTVISTDLDKTEVSNVFKDNGIELT